MRSQPIDEVQAVKTLVQNLIKQQQRLCGIFVQKSLDQLKIIVVIQYVQIIDDMLVRNFALTVTGNLVENGKGIAHAPVRFQGYGIQGFRFRFDTFGVGYVL